MNTPRDDAPELLACPFCGGKADWSFGTYGDGAIWRHIACVSCDAMGPAVARANWTDVEAVAGWNRRASLATPPAAPAATTDNTALVDHKLDCFMQIMATVRTADTSDDSGNWMNVFCADRGNDDDTFNMAIQLGFIKSTYDGEHDWGEARITDAGNAYVAALASREAPPAAQDDAERVAEAARVLLSDNEACLRFAEGFDREDAAQMGEPSPHIIGGEDYAAFAADRISCVKAGLRALVGRT